MPKSVKYSDSLIIKNAAQIVSPKPGILRGEGLKELTVLHDASIYIKENVIQAVGLPEQVKDHIDDSPRIIDAAGKTVLPGFVDSHTHLVFGGRREAEFARRCAGVSYEEIARQGGGILSTVRATRQMSEEQLIEQGLYYLRKAVRHGTTTMEIKSGYGLNEETELKMLSVIQKLNKIQPVELTATFLAAHAVPPDTTKQQYIEQIKSMLPKAAELADYCDVFCELGYFDADETRNILTMALKHGLKPRVHSNQFHSIGGIQAAIDVGAVSVDHLENITDAEIELLAKTDICAAMLPGVSLFLNIPYAPGRKILDAGCIPVLATDFNPGSCMTLSMPLILTLACTQMGFSIEEAVCAVTQNGAFALGREKLGCLEPGRQADLIILDTDNYQNLVYFFGEQHIEQVFKKGRIIFDRNESWDVNFDAGD
ncbi:imidazolonepropionase [candidate division KSB1 bacterium]|nr:imidazolonepropionase [candidate division KSB1 bacterium]